jgi:hypothetical protein
MIPVRSFVVTAGCLHFLQLPAMVAARRILAWPDDLARLQPVSRLLFKVIVAFIMLTVMGLGAVIVSAPDQLLDGNRLGIGLGAFLCLFWSARALIQAFVLAKTFPRDSLVARLGARGLVVLFGFLALSYGVAAAVSVARAVSS